MGEVAGALRRIGLVLVLTTALSGCWLQIGFGPENQRYNPFANGITTANVATLSEQWSTARGSEPIATGNRVYFTTDTGVRAVDGRTGETVWDRDLHPFAGSPTPVVLVDGALWVSQIAAPDQVGMLRLDPDTGGTLGSFPGEFVAGSAVAGSGVVAYRFATFDGTSFSPQTLMVRDAETLAEIWTATYPDDSAVLQPVIANGRIFVMEQRGDGVYELHAYAAAGCGAAICPPVWTTTESFAFSGLAAAGDRVVVTRPFRWADTPLGQSPEYAVVEVLAADTGATLWSTRSPDNGSITGLAVAEDTIQVTTQVVPENPAGGSTPGPFGSDSVSAFPLNGCGATSCSPSWRVALPSRPAGLVIGGDIAYTGVGNDIVALDRSGCGAATCEPLAAITLEEAAEPSSVAGSQLYVRSSSTLTALAPS